MTVTYLSANRPTNKYFFRSEYLFFSYCVNRKLTQTSATRSKITSGSFHIVGERGWSSTLFDIALVF
jgi:hypothetical protein